jgi:TrmH RNA methyltransferase
VSPPRRPAAGRERSEKPAEPRIHARALVRICGLPAVKALFERDPERALRLFYEPRLRPALSRLSAMLAAQKKPYREAAPEELAHIAGSLHHGGVVAIARARPFEPFKPKDLASWVREEKPILILDGIGNSHNLGAIARTAAFFGVEKMILADRPEQARPGDASYRVAEGGLEYLSLYRAPLAEALPALRPLYRLIATASDRGSPPDLSPGRFSYRGRPAALVLGNEEAGLEPKVLALCDEVIRIPGAGRIPSLNVAAAAAILLYLLTRG